MIIGGDDSRLYYFFPFEYIKNYQTNIISDNAIGTLGSYFPQSHLIVFVSLLAVLKSIIPFVNIQLLVFGFVLAFGFLTFYLLTGALFSRFQDNKHFLIRVCSSFFYIFSPILFFDLWSNMLFSLFLIPLIPLLLFLFIRSIYEKDIVYIFIATFFLTIFNFTAINVPWFAGTIIAVSPLLIYITIKNLKHVILYGLTFFGLFIAANAFWIFDYVYSPFSSENSYNVLSLVGSSEFRQANITAIETIASKNNIIFPLFNLFQGKLMHDFAWGTYALYRTWFLSEILVGSIFLLIVCAVLMTRPMIKENNGFFSYVAMSWLLAAFLFSANLGTWGTNLFVWMNIHIPAFSMFRNMYDKFALAVALTSAMLLCIAATTVFDNIPERFKKGFIVVMFLMWIPLSIPLIENKILISTIHGTTNQPFINDFNKDYYSLIAKVSTFTDSYRFLWLPMNTASYPPIQDSIDNNRFYYGISPLQILSGKNDMSGYLSFGAYADKIFDDIVNDDYDEAGQYLGQLGIGYIITNNLLPDSIKTSGIWSYKGKNYLLSNEATMEQHLLGAKLSDFGGRYSLYKMNSKYLKDKLFLSEQDHPGQTICTLTYKKLNSYSYSVDISNLSNDQSIYFLEPYHELWEWYTPDMIKTVLSGEHDFAYDYANSWGISADHIRNSLAKKYYSENKDGSINARFILFFKPARYIKYNILISCATIVFIMTLIFRRCLALRRSNRANKNILK